MRIIIFSAALGAAMALASSGCESGGASKASFQKQQFEMMKSQDERISQLSAKVSSLQDSNAELIRQNSELGQKLNALEQRTQSFDNMAASLKQEISEERQERQAAVNAVIDQVSKNVAKAINTAASVPPPRSEPPKAGPAGKGNFIVYKVDSGATLKAIADAYKVSVEDIKKANNLKGDSIRAGQTIYIPKKD